MTDKEITLKNLRFSKDFNLPINIFNEEMFSYYRALYSEFWPYDEEDLMNKTIEKYGNVEKWLEYCGSVRDRAITSVMETEEYKKFNTEDLSEKYPYVQVCGERSCYNEETHGKYFISIDLKKANFQALKYAGVINDDTYKDFIYRMGGDEYIANSKYLRQVIFGKMNAGRTVKVEKYLIYQIYLLIKDEILSRGYELFSMNSDELVFKELSIENNYKKEELSLIEKKVKDSLNIDIRAERVLIQRLNIKNYRGNKVDAYVRWNLDTDEQVLKKASTTFFPQIYKLWKGLDITENDRRFFIEGQLATFNEPLELFDNNFEV